MADGTIIFGHAVMANAGRAVTAESSGWADRAPDRELRFFVLKGRGLDRILSRRADLAMQPSFVRILSEACSLSIGLRAVVFRSYDETSSRLDLPSTRTVECSPPCPSSWDLAFCTAVPSGNRVITHDWTSWGTSEGKRSIGKVESIFEIEPRVRDGQAVGGADPAATTGHIKAVRPRCTGREPEAAGRLGGGPEKHWQDNLPRHAFG